VVLVPPITTLDDCKVDPLVNVIVPFLTVFPYPPTFTAVVTISLGLPVVEKVKNPVLLYVLLVPPI